MQLAHVFLSKQSPEYNIPQCVQIRCLPYKHDESLANQLWQWQSEIITHLDDLRMTYTNTKLVWGIAYSKWYAFEVRQTDRCGRLCLFHLTVLHYWLAIYAPKKKKEVISSLVWTFSIHDIQTRKMWPDPWKENKSCIKIQPSIWLLLQSQHSLEANILFTHTNEPSLLHDFIHNSNSNHSFLTQPIHLSCGSSFLLLNN